MRRSAVSRGHLTPAIVVARPVVSARLGAPGLIRGILLLDLLGLLLSRAPAAG